MWHSNATRKLSYHKVTEAYRYRLRPEERYFYDMALNFILAEFIHVMYYNILLGLVPFLRKNRPPGGVDRLRFVNSISTLAFIL